MPMLSRRAVTVQTEQRIFTSYFHSQNSLEKKKAYKLRKGNLKIS